MPGGRCPSPQPPSHPIRPIGPGLPQKAGVSLFVAATARKLSEGREGMSFLTRLLPDPTAPRLTPSFGGCVAWMQGMYDNTNHSVQSHRASCVVQSLPTAAPSILRRLFAKLRLAQDRSEADNNPDDIQALLMSAIEMARGSPRPSQLSTDQGARTPAALASSMRAKRVRTSRIVQIQRDPQETAFLARDTKSGLVVMRHEDSKRLQELCDWFGWQVIDGGMPSGGN